MTDEKRNWNPLVFLVKQLIKYLPKSKYRSTIIVSLIFTFIFFIVFQFSRPQSFIRNIEISAGFFVVSAFLLSADDLLGRKQHKKALYGKCLRQLKDFGLLIENTGDYWGYTGIISKYYMKIFYNWFTFLPGKGTMREICIMAYYLPPKTKAGNVDIKRLNALNEKYKNGWLSSTNYIVRFESAHIEIHTGYYGRFTSFKTIKKRIDLAFDILEKENLPPVSESEVSKLISEDAYKYGPYIETYWKAKGVLE